MPRLTQRFAGWLVPLVMLGSAPAMAATARPIDVLARDLERTESLRAVKDVHRRYAQLAQFGLWKEMADLFADRGTAAFAQDRAEGRAAVGQLIAARFGGGRQGLAPGAFHTELTDAPLANLSTDGRGAKVRWYGMLFQGDGRDKARISGGIYENSYVLERGVWKIAALDFHPQYEGPYETGWINVGAADLPIVPFHFTVDESGIPIPPAQGEAPRARATLAEIGSRVAALNDEDAVRNLQNAYGYYVDRKMWDDVVDLFAGDGVFEVAGVGRYRGPAGVRRALERMGPAGLRHGELNERPIFSTIVQVMPGGREAFARGIEFGMLGDADKGSAQFAVSVFRNRFVKEGGLWKLREVRLFPLIRSDYYVGFARSRLPEPVPTGALVPDAPAVAAKGIPAFLKGDAPGSTLFTAPVTPVVSASASDVPDTIAEATRRLAVSAAFDGAENVSSAYGYYIDDFQWPEMAGIFAKNGNKQVPFAGYFLGRDRILGSVKAQWGEPPALRPGISYHWRTQPVINVAADGRSANLRTRLFQPRTSKEVSRPKQFYAAGLNGGMYPNDQMVLEGGVWRIWSLTIDEPYFASVDWKGGWSAAKEPEASAAPRRSILLDKYPPDILISDLGKREEGFRGGTGKTIDWPGILPMWFNYRNPVSGREPENYWPDCVPCTHTPATSMVRHGFLMPPTGPAPEPRKR